MLLYRVTSLENDHLCLGGNQMLHKLSQKIDKLQGEMIKIRRYLHMNPELSFQEENTAKYISEFYDKLNIPYVKNVGGNGVVARIKGKHPGKTVALRADFDALPIQDEKDVPYKSQVANVMHACGHDGHTATLLTLAKAFQSIQDELKGTVVFVHQHAEEQVPGGAKPILESGELDDVEAVFGTHLWSLIPLGTVETSREACMAGADKFEITIQGKGGHGAYPHETKDSIVIGSELVLRLQQIVSRRVNPMDTAVLSIGEFIAGKGFNVIADQAKISGTVRYFKQSVQEAIISEITNAINGLKISHDIEITLDYEKGYPALINHEKEAELVIDAASEVSEVKNSLFVEPNMAGEDFAYYMQEKRGAFFFTGAMPENAYPHHHPKFDINEDALPIAAKVLANAYLKYQES